MVLLIKDISTKTFLYQTRPLMEREINFFNTPITQLTNDEHN